MKRTLAFAVAVLMIATTSDAAMRRRAVRSPSPSPSDLRYLKAARDAARWLDSVERRNGAAISWPESTARTFARPGLGNGAAGIGAFFLRMHQVTGEAQYLEKARGAAQFVADEFRRSRTAGFDWQTGAVGAGEFFILMYRDTREQRYLDDARMIADTLLAMATRNAEGIHWTFTGTPNVYTGISHGAAGAGMFFVHLYEFSGRADDLQVARDAYRWMREYTVPLANGFGWKRLTKDTAAYHGFCGGSSGILYLIDELHRATGDAAYLQDLVSTADGLASSPRTPAAGQAAWPYTNVSTGTAPVIYCHGTSCATTALAHAWTLTGDVRYQNVARDGAGHLNAIATTIGGDGPVWEHIERSQLIESGFQTGVASVGYTFLRLHSVFGERQYLDRAIDSGNYLLRVANRPAAGQMRWLNILQQHPEDTEVPTYETGWYQGAAGIGLFLLDLHDRLNGRPALTRFSPIHP